MVIDGGRILNGRLSIKVVFTKVDVKRHVISSPSITVGEKDKSWACPIKKSSCGVAA
jgi:hypothetical protein